MEVDPQRGDQEVNIDDSTTQSFESSSSSDSESEDEREKARRRRRRGAKRGHRNTGL